MTGRFLFLREKEYEKTPTSSGLIIEWSKRRESDPRIYLGKVMFYH